jgi:hypothetical protein
LNDDDYKSWIDRVQVHFPSLWQNLSNVRNVDDRQSKHLIQGKKVQVLHQILTIFRQQDSQVLKWWALIEMMGLMSWGVGRTAMDTLSYLGTHVSCATRVRMLNSLFGPLFDEQVKNTMSSTSHITLIIDNFQVGQRLKNQRGGHSSNFIFMSGTNQIAEKPRVYDNPKYKTKKPKTELQYNLEETYPSPDGMPALTRHHVRSRSADVRCLLPLELWMLASIWMAVNE